MPTELEGQAKNEGEGAKPKGEGENTANSAGGEGEKGTGAAAAAGTPPATFTQEQVNTLVGDARVKSRDTAVASALSDLGFTDVDSLKLAIGEYNDAKRASLTELEKAQGDLTALTGADTRAKELEATNKAMLKVIEEQTNNLLETLKVPDHVKPLIEAMPILERLAYLTEHGKEFSVEPTPPAPKPNINSGGKGSNGTANADKTAREGILHKYKIR